MSNERVPWEESNLAGIGSDLDKKIREAAAENEAQWEDIGQEPCVKVWRIEQFQVVPWPENKNGRFHVGDSYIVLNSYLVEDKLCHDVHIWIGSESSQDEYGTAAYKMVECDDSLGGIAVQHREVQGYESDLFKSYFGNLMYLTGGVESGFTHVEATVEEPHLYRVKGTEKAMSLTQVPVERASMNAGDCFILFLGSDTVFLWNGAKSNPDERSRAIAVAESMATDGTVVVLDQGDGDADAAAFWEALGGYEDDIVEEQEDDEEVTEFVPTLYRLPGDGDVPEMIAEGELLKIGWGKPTPKISKSLLDTTDVFLLDTGWELVVWMGKESDRSERLAAMGHVDAYGQFMPRAKHLPVSILKEGYETSAFDDFFVK